MKVSPQNRFLKKMDRGCPCAICDDTSHKTARCPELYHPEKVSGGGGGGHDHDDDDDHLPLITQYINSSLTAPSGRREQS